MSNALSILRLQDDYQASYRQLLQFFARRTGNEEDARELAQQLWLKLQRDDVPDVSPQDGRAYLFGMARNLLIDHLRRHRLAEEHQQAWQALHADEPSCAGAEKTQIQRALLAAADEALAQLPERTRDVFVQYRVYGVGHDELAARHGVTRSTIERDVRRASEALDALLDEWDASETNAASDASAAGNGSNGSHGSHASDAVTPDTAAQQGTRRRRFLGSLFSLAAMVSTSGTLWHWWQHSVPQWEMALNSRMGQRLSRRLPDGSHITLDAASHLNLAYFGVRREAQLLQGAAFFDVATDAQRPFHVDAGPVRITVLGTRFCVDLQPAQLPAPADGHETAAAGSVEIAVESGRVRVEPLPASAAGTAPWQPMELTAGQVLRIDAGQAPRPAQISGTSAIAPWRDGWLGFRNARLDEVIARLSRYTDLPITLAAPAAHLPITTEIRIAQAAEWLRLLPNALPVQVQWLPDATAPGRMRVHITAKGQRTL